MRPSGGDATARSAEQRNDTSQPFELLRAQCERRSSCRTSNCFDEIASSHCRPRQKTTLWSP
jgi:hypothetical protein